MGQPGSIKIPISGVTETFDTKLCTLKVIRLSILMGRLAPVRFLCTELLGGHDPIQRVEDSPKFGPGLELKKVLDLVVFAKGSGLKV